MIFVVYLLETAGEVVDYVCVYVSYGLPARFGEWNKISLSKVNWIRDLHASLRSSDDGTNR